MPSRTTGLNWDIFLVVLEHLPRQSDVAAMSRASKKLHAASIGYLLLPGVTISTGAQLASFTAFLSSDVATRAPKVRKLYFKLGVDESDLIADMDGEDKMIWFPKNIRLVGTVLRKTTQLEDLSIDSCEELLQCERGIFKAIIVLKNLRRLRVSSIGELTASVFDKVKSSLVEIDYDCYHGEMDSSEEPDDPTGTIDRHRSTLQRLSASYVQVQDTDCDFPHVRALALRRIFLYDAGVLRKVFPNLEYLELSPGVHGFDDYELVREASREDYVDGTWNALQHLCGSLEALYGLALTRGVKRVDVDDIDLTSECLARLHTLITDTSPSHLLMHVGYGDEADKVEGAKIGELLAIPEASCITHLVLDLCLSTLTGSPDHLMDGVVALLFPLSVSVFVLRLNKCVGSDEQASSAPAADDTRYNTEVYEAFQPPAYDALAHQLAVACPHLAHVSFDVMGHVPSWWAVARSNGDVALRQLELMVWRELVVSEGLWFNDRTMPVGLSAYI
ncbi:hypothetical protein L227DRAFT_599177 [Lentinus tigrinus ALCF2SS1-6]|uniref:F-box domain-containing protein n=1 Tax=Lentinus tigrinus ALCF2SS1-6 TaxID=1328759 RepID=A0A5C2SK59_9APHY|nr:hypothetical protein L227DRAFT_599177 [Lentinus tigrinus ALCF2SS1-6]